MSAPLTPPAAATLRWIVTEHALDRYIDRFSPAAFAEEVRDQIIALLAEAVVVGHKDDGDPRRAGELLGHPSLPAATFLVRTDPDGTRVCVTVLDAIRHQRSFRAQKGPGLHARSRRGACG